MTRPVLIKCFLPCWNHPGSSGTLVEDGQPQTAAVHSQWLCSHPLAKAAKLNPLRTEKRYGYVIVELIGFQFKSETDICINFPVFWKVKERVAANLESLPGLSFCCCHHSWRDRKWREGGVSRAAEWAARSLSESENEQFPGVRHTF